MYTCLYTCIGISPNARYDGCTSGTDMRDRHGCRHIERHTNGRDSNSENCDTTATDDANDDGWI